MLFAVALALLAAPLLLGATRPAQQRLAAGQNYFNVILPPTNQVISWGNGYGLGRGIIMESNEALPMLGISGASQVCAGLRHSCVLINRAVYCTGTNHFEQLGPGGHQLKPRVVPGFENNVEMVICGGYHTCAILNAVNSNSTRSVVQCLGSNLDGQLANGRKLERVKTPSAVVPFEEEGAVAVSGDAGESHTCIVTSAGALYCAGLNYYGQLGDGTNVGKLVLTRVSMKEVIMVSCGMYHTCALTTTSTSERTVYCFGRNTEGQLGDGTLVSKNLPTAVPAWTHNIASVSSSFYTTCVVHDDERNKRTASCVGVNLDDMFALGRRQEFITSPLRYAGVDNKRGIKEIRQSYNAICVLDVEDKVLCSGASFSGQLGAKAPAPRHKLLTSPLTT